TRRNDVRGDPVRTDLIRNVPDESDERRGAGPVGDHARRGRTIRVFAANVNQPTPTLVSHHRQHRLCNEKCRTQPALDALTELRPILIFKSPLSEASGTGIVNHDVDASKGPERLCYEVLYLLLVPHVSLNRSSALAAFDNLLDNLFCACLVGAIV